MKLSRTMSRTRLLNSTAVKLLLSASLLTALMINLMLLTLPPLRSSEDDAGSEDGDDGVSGGSGRPQRSLSRGHVVSGAASQLARSRRISQHNSLYYEGDTRPSVGLEIWCSQNYTALAIDGVLLVNDSTAGVHVFIVNQATAALMGHHPVGSWDQAQTIILSVSAGRLLVLTRVPRPSTDPASPSQQSLPRRDTSWVFRSLGSRQLETMQDTDSWILVAFSKVGRLKEKRLPMGQLLILSATVKLSLKEEPLCPLWIPGAETTRRQRFCSHVDGFSNVCNCGDPSPISFVERPLPWFGSIFTVVPITVMSSNRPQFLYRTLSSTLQLPGLNASQVSVLLRGYFDEPRLICELLQLEHSQHKQLRDSRSNLYRLGMADTISRFETAQYIILLEDDIDPSPDLIDFFNQTLPLFITDKDLFCIGAWNEQSFTHTSRDPSQLYRTQIVPLKAVAFRRQLWEEELIAQWPEEPIDLVQWLSEVMGPQRYCLKPALSRIFVYSQSVQLIRQFSPRHLTSANGSNRLLIQSTAEYDRDIQSMLDRAHNLNGRISGWNCRTVLRQLIDEAGNLTTSRAKPLPVYLVSVRVPNKSALRAFWNSVVARCFELHPLVSCLYKGVCNVRFEWFTLLVNFKPFSQFLVTNSGPDIVFPNKI